MTTEETLTFETERVLASINNLSANRPVAARIVALAEAEDTGAKQLADILAADVALAGRVMKLANSAYSGMRGRVSSLQTAVTAVGFTTVRTMATVALTDLDDESGLPEDFWLVSTRMAIAASRLAPKFGEASPDALCLGVLAQLGSALLYHHDHDAYVQLQAIEPSFAGRRRAERRRYGLSSVELTAMALRTWGFPLSIITPLEKVDDRTSRAGGLLRASYEVVSRLTVEDHQPVPIAPLTGGTVREEALPEILYAVRSQAEELRQLMLGDQSGTTGSS